MGHTSKVQYESDSFEVPKLTQPSQDSFTNPGPGLVVGSTNHPVRTGCFIPYIPCSFPCLNSGSSACIHLIILSQENCRNPKPAKQQENKAMATNGEDQQKQAGRHQEVGHKSLLQSDALYQVTKHIHIIKVINFQNPQQQQK